MLLVHIDNVSDCMWRLRSISVSLAALLLTAQPEHRHLHLQFEDDVYVATSEPHGSIEATVTRGDVQPHCKL